MNFVTFDIEINIYFWNLGCLFQNIVNKGRSGGAICSTLFNFIQPKVEIRKRKIRKIKVKIMETEVLQSFIRHARFPVLLVMGVILYQFGNGPKLEPKFIRSKFLFRIVYLYFAFLYQNCSFFYTTNLAFLHQILKFRKWFF